MARIESTFADHGITAALTAVIIYVVYKLFWKNNGDPKAPPALPGSLPLIGNADLLSPACTGSLHACCVERARRYGTVFSFYAANKYTVVLNGYDAIHEALLKRSTDFASVTSCTGDVFSQQCVWTLDTKDLLTRQHDERYRRHRLQSVAVLKQLSVGDGNILEAKVHSQLSRTLELLRAKHGAALDPSEIITITVLSIFYDLFFGRRFETEDSEDIFLRDALEKFNQSSADSTCEMFSFLLPASTLGKRRRAQRIHSEKLIDIFIKKIRETNKASERDTTTHSFVTAYVKITGSDYDEIELAHILRDLIVAGAEKISTQLRWALVLLGNHPEVQKNIQAEMDSVVAEKRLPAVVDKSRLPRLEAAMLEVMRMRTIVPMGSPHLTLCGTRVAGYNIPAETLALTNLWSSNMDPKFWSEPDTFKPGRFLDKDGNVVNRDLVLGFSIGKRACPGELLAEQEMFLLLAGLLQQFDILPPEGETCIVNEMKANTVLLSPAPFEVRLVQRP